MRIENPDNKLSRIKKSDSTTVGRTSAGTGVFNILRTFSGKVRALQALFRRESIPASCSHLQKYHLQIPQLKKR